MTNKYKNIISPLLGQKTKGWIQTEPSSTELYDYKMQKEAKMCLFDLNKDIDVSLIPFREKKVDQTDFTVSEWQIQNPQHYLNHCRKDEVLKRKNSSKKRVVNCFSKQKLNLVEQSLIDKGRYRMNYDRENQNQTEIIQCLSLDKKMRAERQDCEAFSLERTRQLSSLNRKMPKESMNVKQMQFAKRNKIEKDKTVDKGELGKAQTQRIFCDKLPRLDRMRPKDSTDKYRCIFRMNNAMKYPVPKQDIIKRDMGKLFQLISQENITLIRPMMK